MGPLAVVEKLLQSLLQVFEDALVRARNLGVVDRDLGLQLLRRNCLYGTEQNPYHTDSFHPLTGFSPIR